jgi:hypothetical protein
VLAVCAVLAGWAKPRWLQWVGVGGMFVQNIFFWFSTRLVPESIGAQSQFC